MPPLKTRYLFISHAWHRSEHYNKIVEWLNEERNFDWHNYSVPEHDKCDETSSTGLKRCLGNQLRPAQAAIILAGMYANHSGWVDYEIREANRMDKTIIGVYPWGQERTPQIITDLADEMVHWNRSSVIDAVRRCVKAR